MEQLALLASRILIANSCARWLGSKLMTTYRMIPFSFKSISLDSTFHKVRTYKEYHSQRKEIDTEGYVKPPHSLCSDISF